MRVVRNKLFVGLLVCVLLVATSVVSGDAVALDVYDPPADKRPSIVAMGLDFLVVRPLALVITVGGAALWFVSSPFSAIGGNVEEAADKLVLEPGRYTFVRPLGHKQLDSSPIWGEESLEEEDHQ